MITKSQAEILAIIMSWGDAGGTTELVFKATADNKDTEISEIKQVSAIAGELKKSGLISTFAGKVKAHVITKQGMLALDEFNAAPVPTIQPQLIGNSKPIEAKLSITSALNLVQNSGYTTLDPTNKIDSNFATIIEYIRFAESLPPPPTIERKQQKIDTLTRLSLLMSDDIKTVFEEIAKDLEQMEAA